MQELKSLENRVAALEQAFSAQTALTRDLINIIRRAAMQQAAAESKLMDTSDPQLRARTEEVRRALGQIIGFASKSLGTKRTKPKMRKPNPPTPAPKQQFGGYGSFSAYAKEYREGNRR